MLSDDDDVAAAVGARAHATDRGSMLLQQQRQRVWELEEYTARQVEMLQCLDHV